jgi:hypothetical protein
MVEGEEVEVTLKHAAGLESMFTAKDLLLAVLL